MLEWGCNVGESPRFGRKPRNGAFMSRWHRKVPGLPQVIRLSPEERAAENGDAESQYQMGLRYLMGVGKFKEILLAQDWFGRAARQGHCGALRQLGLIALRGEGFTNHLGGRDFAYRDALRCFEKAAKRQDAKSAYFLGRMHEHGLGTAKSRIEAAKWYRRAIKDGSEEAKTRMEMLLQTYAAEFQAEFERIQTVYESAESGHAELQFVLGKMYVDGSIDADNYEEAAQWFLKAAKQGHRRAQANLAWMYRHGKGVPKNQAEAEKWQLDSERFQVGGLHMRHHGKTLYIEKIDPIEP